MATIPTPGQPGQPQPIPPNPTPPSPPEPIPPQPVPPMPIPPTAHPQADPTVVQGTRRVMLGAVFTCVALIVLIFGWFLVVPHLAASR
jgi:hypothetical protein